MQGRLSDDVAMPMTMINPPASQEMQMPESPKVQPADGKREAETEVQAS